MTNRSANLREKYLDGEKLFRKYIEMGDDRNINLLVEWSILKGMTSSKGETPTPMGVWKSMWRWASQNRELVWSLVKGETFGTKKNPVQYTEKSFVRDMINVKIPSAWQHNTPGKRERFLRRHGWINGS